MDADFSCCNYKLLQGTQLTSTPQKCVVTENILLTTYFAYTPKDFLFSKYVFTRAEPKEKDFLFF